jgi:hypothetical protein
MSARIHLEVGRKRGHVSARLYECGCCTYPAPGRPLQADPPIDDRLDPAVYDVHYDFACDDMCRSCRDMDENWYWADIDGRYTLFIHKTLTAKLGDMFK